MTPPPSLTVKTLPPQALPPLIRIDPRADSVLRSISPPRKRIHSDQDLLKWKNSKAYADVVLFVGRLGEAAVGKQTRQRNSHEDLARHSSLPTGPSHNKGIQAIVSLLQTLHRWTEEIRPRDTPQRFGNLAFRDWGDRLEKQVDDLHHILLADHQQLLPFIPELFPYLLDSFGSFVRIDYGSGHEVTFVAWLGLLFKLGFFDDDSVEAIASAATSGCPGPNEEPTHIESALALEVLPFYLQVVWELQDRYALEPAGSHGVWGLDDYHFIPYIIGSAQLRQQISYHPSQFSSKSHKPAARLSAAELLTYLPNASATSVGDSTSSSISATSPNGSDAPFPNLFTSSIARIHSLKSGPFHEHSPLLYDVSTSVPNWLKVSKGMLRMWEVEVLGKRPVVQHFVFGGVGWSWEGGEVAGGETENAERTEERKKQVDVGQDTKRTVPVHAVQQAPPTRAPWAVGSTMPPTSMPSTTSRPPSSANQQSPLNRLAVAQAGKPQDSDSNSNPLNRSAPLSIPPPSTTVSGTAAPWATGGTSAPAPAPPPAPHWPQAQADRRS